MRVRVTLSMWGDGELTPRLWTSFVAFFIEGDNPGSGCFRKLVVFVGSAKPARSVKRGLLFVAKFSLK
jgi:hypothetical protein